MLRDRIQSEHQLPRPAEGEIGIDWTEQLQVRDAKAEIDRVQPVIEEQLQGRMELLQSMREVAPVIGSMAAGAHKTVLEIGDKARLTGVSKPLGQRERAVNQIRNIKQG